MNDAAQALLDFWFGDLTDGLATPEHRRSWFEVDPEFDRRCAYFAPLLEQAAAGELTGWSADPRSLLALIVLCDQLPRNIHRGRAQAFAYDRQALQLARNGVIGGSDRQLGWDERSFFYLPFEHSEDLLDQHLAVGLFSLLRDESPKAIREHTGNTLRYAQKHRDIIVRFGRFPHRNAALGRKSTPAEEAFLAAGNDFGQAAATEQRVP